MLVTPWVRLPPVLVWLPLPLVPLVAVPDWLAEPLPESVLATETGALTELGSVAEISDPLLLLLLLLLLLPPPPLVAGLVAGLVVAEPFPESVLSAETGTFTEFSPLTETSDPLLPLLPVPLVPVLVPPVLLLVPLVAGPDWLAEPSPEPVLATETGALTELGRVAEISDPLLLLLLPPLPPLVVAGLLVAEPCQEHQVPRNTLGSPGVVARPVWAWWW